VARPDRKRPPSEPLDVPEYLRGQRTPGHLAALDRMQGLPPSRSYRQLKEQVVAAGLLDRQPVYYTLRISWNFFLLGFCIFLLFRVDSLPFQLLVTAPLLAFTYVQLAFIAHNSGHRQVGLRAWQDTFLTHLHLGLLLGTSASWWLDRHNEHHGKPNIEGEDPDIDFPFLAFREEEALASRGLARRIVKYQAVVLPFLSVLVPFNMRLRSILKIIQGEARHPVRESLLMVAHTILYLGLLFTALPVAGALLFHLIHYMLTGLYFFSVFAANHKGMPVLDSDHKLDFISLQVLTARNIHSHPLTDFFYGGLNYQIEHHLFPTMPQNKLREAQRIVRRFCEEEQLPYYETSFPEAQREILFHLHEVSRCVRSPHVMVASRAGD
jgi:fatty acid desaturase